MYRHSKWFGSNGIGQPAQRLLLGLALAACLLGGARGSNAQEPRLGREAFETGEAPKAAEFVGRPLELNACPGNLVQNWGFIGSSHWTSVGTPDFSAPTSQGALDPGYVGMWGNMDFGLGERLEQALAIKKGRHYRVWLFTRHIEVEGRVPYSQIEVRFSNGGSPPQSLMTKASSDTNWHREDLPTLVANADYSKISVRVSNEYPIHDASKVSHAHIDNLCMEELPPAICGTKYLDANCNGKRDRGEIGLPGWGIVAANQNGTAWTATTGSGGEFCFEGLRPGRYSVGELAQPGWSQSAPRGDGRHQVTLRRGERITGIDFGNSPCCCDARTDDSTTTRPTSDP